MDVIDAVLIAARAGAAVIAEDDRRQYIIDNLVEQPKAGLQRPNPLLLRLRAE